MNRFIANMLTVACLMSMSACQNVQFNGEQSVQGAAQSALSGSGNILVKVDGRTATVSGWVEDRYDEMAIMRAVSMHRSIDQAINRLQIDPFIFKGD
jgi:hypothetical protein